MPTFNFNNNIIWKDIIGFEDYYQISNTGLVKCKEHIVKCNNTIRICKEHIVKTGNNGRGYLFVNLYRNNKSHRFYVHRLIAVHFIDNPNNYKEVHHKDKNKFNNTVENLEWIDNSEHKNIDFGIKIMRNDGIIYNSIKEAAISNNLCAQTIRYRLNKNLYTKNKYKVSFKYITK